MLTFLPEKIPKKIKKIIENYLTNDSFNCRKLISIKNIIKKEVAIKDCV